MGRNAATPYLRILTQLLVAFSLVVIIVVCERLRNFNVVGG